MVTKNGPFHMPLLELCPYPFLSAHLKEVPLKLLSSFKTFRFTPGQPHYPARSKILATCLSKPQSELCPCHRPAGTHSSPFLQVLISDPSMSLHPTATTQIQAIITSRPEHNHTSSLASHLPPNQSPFSKHQRKRNKSLNQGIPHV